MAGSATPHEILRDGFGYSDADIAAVNEWRRSEYAPNSLRGNVGGPTFRVENDDTRLCEAVRGQESSRIYFCPDVDHVRALLGVGADVNAMGGYPFCTPLRLVRNHIQLLQNRTEWKVGLDGKEGPIAIDQQPEAPAWLALEELVRKAGGRDERQYESIGCNNRLLANGSVWRNVPDDYDEKGTALLPDGRPSRSHMRPGRDGPRVAAIRAAGVDG